MNRYVSTLAAVVTSTALGALFYSLSLPLAWLLGPLLATSVISLSGWKVVAPALIRRLGQMGIGTGIGLHVTAAVAASVAIWLPAMIGMALLSIVLAGVLSVVLARLARIDDVTAFYAMLPGGLAEMSNIGASDGAKPEPIALSQALRVGLVVFVLPPAIISLGIDQGIHESNPGLVSWWTVPPLLFIAFVGAHVTRLMGVQNSWMSGALLAVGTASALGWPNGQMLPAVTAAAQFVIGMNVGARFEREQIRRLPRVAFFSTLMILAMTLVSFGLACLMTLLTGLDVATAALALAPGGMAEMATTAQALHLGIVLITGFHVVRAITVNSFGRAMRGVLERSGFLPRIRKFVFCL